MFTFFVQPLSLASSKRSDGKIVPDLRLLTVFVLLPGSILKEGGSEVSELAFGSRAVELDREVDG